MNLALFDLDNTLLTGDSDFEWAQFLISKGVLDREVHEAKNQAFYDDYKAGTLDIHAFLAFQLAPLSRHARAELDALDAVLPGVVGPDLPRERHPRETVGHEAEGLVADGQRRVRLAAAAEIGGLVVVEVEGHLEAHVVERADVVEGPDAARRPERSPNRGDPRVTFQAVAPSCPIP